MDNLIESLRSFIGDNQLQAYFIAFCILVITALIARLCTLIIKKITQHDGSPLPSSSIIKNIVRIVIWVIGISVILSACFNVNVSGLIAALGVGGIAVSLGLQDTIKNLFGGIQITLMRIIEPGDHILYGSSEGVVIDVSWRQTTLEDFLGRKHIVPNAYLSTNEIIKIDPANLITCNIVIDNTGEELDDLIHKMAMTAGTAIKKQAPLKSIPWIRIETIGQDIINAKLFFVLKDLHHVQEARDAALRSIASYMVKPYDTIPQESDESDSETDQNASSTDTASEETQSSTK